MKIMKRMRGVRSLPAAGLAILLTLCGTAQATTVTFTASGTWTAPAGVTSVTVEAWGGGGGGGAATGRPAQGGGGAGGQYATATVAVTPGNIYNIVVGAGGTGGNAANGGTGGSSSFNATSVVAAGGAGGGLAAANNSGGAAGTGSTAGGIGSIIYAGGSGAAGTAACAGGAGGGGAGSGGAGGNATGLTAGLGTAVGGGNGGAGRSTRGSGNPGSVAGGAGSGGCATKNTNQIGGAGAGGRIDITYFAPPFVTSINTASTNPAAPNTSVTWTVTFDQSVTGVDATDFTLIAGGGVSGASITSVLNSTGGTTSDTIWTVTANTGSGTSGTLGLNLVDDDTIVNSSGLALGGTGAGNGNFTGQIYTITLLDHVLINAPATATTLSEAPVTITPHTATHTAIAGAGSISLSTSSGLGDWNIGTGVGSLTPGAANSGLATYVFGAGESSVSLGFTYYTAGTVTLNVTETATGTNLLLNTPPSELANTITFSAPNFVFTNGACVTGLALGAAGQTCTIVNWQPQIAGVDAGNVYITVVNASGVPTRLSPTQVRTRTMDFGLSCYDPASNAGMQASFASVVLPLCQANGAKPTTWSASITASFPANVPSAGPYIFNYPDVGKVELWMRNAAATAQTGSSNPFVVAPHHFGFSAVTAGPLKAGNNFAATVTAYNGLATPTATPNFGLETVPESVVLSLTQCQPTGSGAGSGIFGGSVGAFSAGAASASNLNWSEVGNADLVATNSNYLGSGVTASGNTGTGGTLCSGGPGNVGPFIPDHFITTVSDGCLGCGYTYSGQPFTVIITAYNGLATPTITVNYDGSASTAPNFANDVDLTDANAAGVGQFGVSATPLGVTVGTGGTKLTVPRADFLAGVATLTSVPTYTFNTALTAPTIIKMRATDTVYSSVSSSGFAEGTTQIRSGRIKLSDAHGAETLPLPISATVQYWDGTDYVTSTTDSVSSFATASLVYANCQKLSAASNWPTSCPPPTSATPASVTFLNGSGGFTLSAPGSGKSGSVDMSINVPSYLPSNVARATFGVYKNNSSFIYLREAY